jgi:glycosyltransferase involved in cell wall biosynthesis
VRYSSSYSSSPNHFPSVSVIIPTLNEEKNIVDLLKDIQKQTLQPKEIIVVDATSQDKTVQNAKKFSKVTVIMMSPSPAAQRTAGGKKAKADFLFFLDADVRLPKDFIERVMRLQQQKHFSIACPFYVPYKSSPIITGMYYFFDSLFYILQKLQPSGAGSCIITSREAFLYVNGFDKSLRYDDIAFIRKASKEFKQEIQT